MILNDMFAKKMNPNLDFLIRDFDDLLCKQQQHRRNSKATKLRGLIGVKLKSPSSSYLTNEHGFNKAQRLASHYRETRSHHFGYFHAQVVGDMKSQLGSFNALSSKTSLAAYISRISWPVGPNQKKENKQTWDQFQIAIVVFSNFKLKDWVKPIQQQFQVGPLFWAFRQSSTSPFAQVFSILAHASHHFELQRSPRPHCRRANTAKCRGQRSRKRSCGTSRSHRGQVWFWWSSCLHRTNWPGDSRLADWESS